MHLRSLHDFIADSNCSRAFLVGNWIRSEPRELVVERTFHLNIRLIEIEATSGLVLLIFRVEIEQFEFRCSTEDEHLGGCCLTIINHEGVKQQEDAFPGSLRGFGR